MSDKKEGGKLKLWQFHTIFEDVEKANELMAEQGRDQITTDKVYKLSAIVVEDYCGRWIPGDSMHTSLVISYDKETGRLETENTVYYLEGEADPNGTDMGLLINSIYY